MCVGLTLTLTLALTLTLTLTLTPTPTPTLTNPRCVGRVLQVFALALPLGHPEVGSETHFTERPDRDVNVVFTPRK